MITYPLAVPSEPVAKKISFNPRFAVARNESPFTFQDEVFEHMGQQMAITVELPPMSRAEAEQWVGWSLALNGSLGTFLFGDPLAAAPLGTANGAPVVAGVGQARAKTLNTRGWIIGEVVLRAGDLIQLPHNRLHKVMVDVTSDVNGLAEIDIFPRLREDVLDGVALIINSPQGVWRLSSPVTWNAGEAQIYGLSFSAREAI